MSHRFDEIEKISVKCNEIFGSEHGGNLSSEQYNSFKVFGGGGVRTHPCSRGGGGKYREFSDFYVKFVHTFPVLIISSLALLVTQHLVK